MNQSKSYPKVMSIAGSDSSGGAGIQADLKTFSALGVYGATAITAITAQNTQGVNSQFALEPQMVYDQIAAVMDDIEPSVVKIGMLSNVEIVNAVADALSNYDVKIVLDPVIVSTSGHRLLYVEAQDVIKERLLPMCEIVTPNIPEMETLANMPVSTYEEKEKAANHLLSLGAKSILLKGGHEEGEIKKDYLFFNGQQSLSFVSETILTKNVHGTGCTLSSAIAAFIARGLSLEDAVREAKLYVTEAIRAGADVKIGHGFGPVNHFFNPLPLIKNER